MTLKAKLTKELSNGKNYGGKKEVVAVYHLVAYYKGGFHSPVIIRCYMGRSSQASTVYASIWVSGKDFWTSGSGSAGGYGYCKISAAVQGAIDSAGIELYGDVYGREETKKRASIHGVGTTAIRSAIEAIGKALGFRKFTIVEV